MQEKEPMWETCSVELRVQLPRPLAMEVEEVQRENPEIISQILQYGLTRRVIFEQMSKAEGRVAER